MRWEGKGTDRGQVGRVEGAPLEANQRRDHAKRDLEASLGCLSYEDNLEMENQVQVSWMITSVLSCANLQ